MCNILILGVDLTVVKDASITADGPLMMKGDGKGNNYFYLTSDLDWKSNNAGTATEQQQYASGLQLKSVENCYRWYKK